MKHIQWELVVFDLDGTVAETAAEIAWCLNTTLADWQLSPYPVPTVKTFIGNGARVLASRALDGRQAELEAAGHTPGDALHKRFFSDLMVHYGASDNARSTLFEGVPGFLENAPMPVALLTNKPRVSTNSFLAAFSLENAFRMVVTPDDAPTKPDPTGLQRIMETVGASPDRTLMVGDGVPDIQVAHAAGTKSCALLQGFATEADLRAENPDWVFNTFQDFAKAFKVI